MKSIATAEWKGGLKDGRGTISTAGGALAEAPYSFRTRFESSEGKATNPEELIAAAHAGCYAMATSSMLGAAGFTPTSLRVQATVTLQPVDEKPTVTGSHLEMTATIPGITQDKFAEIAEKARAGCVVSRLLDTEITLDARLGG